mgnify:FL=1
MSLDIKSVVKEPAFLKDLSVLHGDRLIQIIALAIERECDDLNFNSNLSPGQVLELSAMIVEGWPYETLEDILMAFKAFKQGKLSINISKLFKFSIPDAMNILNAYLVEVKAPELESHNKTKHIEENESVPLGKEEVRKRIHDYLSGMKERMNKKREIPKEKTSLNSHQELIKELQEKYKDVDPKNYDKILALYTYSERPIVKTALLTIKK